MVDETQLKPLKDWILIRPKRMVYLSVLVQVGDKPSEEDIGTYEVISVGSEVESVNPGDEIVLHGIHGRKFMIEGVEFYAAQEEDIAFIVTQENATQ